MVRRLREHLAMVYQRFLDSADDREPQKVAIWLNGEQVVAWDPFCRGESELVAQQEVPVEMADSDAVAGSFLVRAFVLPRQEEFSTREAADVARIGNSTQGFYIYRENRLIHCADWLGMYSMEPHGSLLRVEFSFDATLDEMLQVDIKKSQIILNESLYDWLKNEFLPAPRRAADQRYRLGLRKTGQVGASAAHSRSNVTIAGKEGQVDQAGVSVVDPKNEQVQVTNPFGTVQLRLKLSSARSPGEVFVQPVDGIDDGLLWQPVLVDGHQGVQLSTAHDYYRKVYLPSIVPKSASSVVVQGLDSLLWALSVAELRTVTEETKNHFSEMRFEVSRILRQLVESLPEPADKPFGESDDDRRTRAD